ncbi:MAG: SHOCT domain-containing protein [Woeseiaceae bacterium]|nr:SHOCT domain-containing protein [Woeseiaceae bacterium]
MKRPIIAIIAASTVGCATLTEDAMTPIAFSFSDGSAGNCQLINKRGAWSADVPSVVSVRKSDDALKYQCETKDGREAVGSIESEMGAKIVASAVFLDFGITDAITDKHRKYVASYVIPVMPKEGAGGMGVASEGADQGNGEKSRYSKLQELEELRNQGILTDAEFESEKKKILDSD